MWSHKEVDVRVRVRVRVNLFVAVRIGTFHILTSREGCRKCIPDIVSIQVFVLVSMRSAMVGIGRPP